MVVQAEPDPARHDHRLHRLERCSRRSIERGAQLDRRLGCPAPRRDRPRTLHRLRHNPSPHPTEGRHDSNGGLADRRSLARPRSRRRHHPRPRARTKPALEGVLRAADGSRRPFRCVDDAHARRVACRRSPQSPRPDHRYGHRPGHDRALQPPALTIRRTDWDHRSDPRHVHDDCTPLRRAVGCSPRVCVPSAVSEGVAVAHASRMRDHRYARSGCIGHEPDRPIRRAGQFTRRRRRGPRRLRRAPGDDDGPGNEHRRRSRRRPVAVRLRRGHG